MKISVVSIQNQGDQLKEVTMLRASEDCNLNNYIITEAKLSREEALSTSFRNTFWFRPTEVKKGDFIMLYTRPGVDGAGANDLGGTTHSIHWNSDRPIWDETEDVAIVLELSSWSQEQTRKFASFV